MYPKLSLVNTAVATSVDYEQNLSINGKTYSHIINPKTGIGLTNKAQVTVLQILPPKLMLLHLHPWY